MTLQIDKLQLFAELVYCYLLLVASNPGDMKNRYPGALQDDAEYYDPPGGLLSLDLHLGSLLEHASHLDVDSTDDPIKVESFVPHFNLINAQLSQVRQLSWISQSIRATNFLN